MITKEDIYIKEIFDAIFSEVPQYQLYRNLAENFILNNFTTEQKHRALNKIWLVFKEGF